ncbi:MAG: DUF2339 domain-containing protein [Candidatus Omnitrophica bacterium]|nr:DUF2339 domain-containing protein [Candidatus Omnitrophota bacterium]
MWLVWLWMISILGTVCLVEQKRLALGGFLLLAIFTGPVALIVVWLSSGKPAVNKEEVGAGNDLAGARLQLQDLRRALQVLEQKAVSLEGLLLRLSENGAEAVPVPGVQKSMDNESSAALAAPAAAPVSVQAAEAAVSPEPAPDAHSDIELDFGRNWLNKIGLAVLALGVAFLISYSFKYFGPFLKVAFGYGVAGALFVSGFRLEAQERLKSYGQALLGGAWAIVYFTTYAMHHFTASRIIASEGVDIFLLIVVVAGMAVHVLKYRSEGMMAVVIMVAYLTLAIGQITWFTGVSFLILAALVLFMVLHFQWVRLLALGVILTYGLHVAWIMPRLFEQTGQNDLMSFVFLSCYWLMFFTGAHLIQERAGSGQARTIAFTNLGNAAFYGFLAYPLMFFFWNWRFEMVLTVGLVYLACALLMKRLGREKMYWSDLTAAVFIITCSFALKFSSNMNCMIWIIEAPLLLFIGTYYKEAIFRYFSYALSVITAVRLMWFWEYHFNAGQVWASPGNLYMWASLAMAACFYLTQQTKKEWHAESVEGVFDQLFSLLAAFYASLWLWQSAYGSHGWSSLLFLIEGCLLAGLSLALRLGRFRVYSWPVMLIGALLFLFGPIHERNYLVKCILINCNVLGWFGYYYVLKHLDKQQPGALRTFELGAAYSLAILVVVATIFQYVTPQWITLVLGLASVVVMLTGFFTGYKIERLGGLALLALTLCRVVVIDLAGVEIIFKIITLMALGVLLLGVSYIYNRFGGEQDRRGK